MKTTAGALGRELLLFQLCGEKCAVRAAEVQEILAMPRLERLPGLPSLLEGFLNLRGTAVPVLNLSRLFDRPGPPPGLHTPLIILRGESCPLAILADAVTAVAGPPAEAFLPVKGNNCFNECAEAEVVVGDHSVHLLSCERILLEKERQCVAELQARAQEYLAELEGANR